MCDLSNLVCDLGNVALGRDAFGECGLEGFGRGARLLGGETAAGQAVDIGELVEQDLGGHRGQS